MKNLAIPNLERSVVSDGKGGYKSPGRTSKTAPLKTQYNIYI